MSSEEWVEVTIEVTDAKGGKGRQEFEYRTTHPTTDVPMELYDHLVKSVGNDRTHLPDPDR